MIDRGCDAQAKARARENWRDRLRAAARASLGDWIDDAIDRRGPHPAVPDRFRPESFRDEFGQTRVSDGPLIAHLLGLPWTAGIPSLVNNVVALESRWWSAVQGLRDAPVIATNEGPLDLHVPPIAIETWTERELAALHAAWHVGTLRRDDAIIQRLLRAADWHVANTQPDHATNHPWAIHVFIERSLKPDADAELFAQTLLHNCHVALGKPDLRSGLILADASRALHTTCLGRVDHTLTS